MATTSLTADLSASPHPRRWAAAAVMTVAALMDLLDVTIVNVAIPSIGRDLGASASALVNVVLSAVPTDLAGGASGIFSTAQQFGGALGAAVVGTVFFAHTTGGDGLTDALSAAMPWVVGAFALCAALCPALPRTAVSQDAPTPG
ncbi:hypothetical protein [Streptomyces sp. NPDC002133]|uniref:hypothetical protein n=1 Tax=Streptomyces sp. NPDC002133 TaxID=3154409 RepID=UPI003331A216